MKRWQISILVGLLITVVLVVMSTFIQSISIVRGLFWQCALFYRTCPPNELCEGTPVDAFFGIICILLSVPIYSLLTYAVLWLVAKKRPGNARG
jgi:hypothetical protein